MTTTRDSIREHIETHPGVHFSELTRALDLATGQVQYHVRRLEREDRVVAESVSGRTHYYPRGYERADRLAIAVLRREVARDVVFFLLEDGPSRPERVATELEIARSTLAYHLDGLTDAGLVEKRRLDGNRMLLAVPDPETALRLLEDIRPTLSETLVDRFMRLVDNLLGDR